MTLTEADTYDLADIYEWVEQRAKYEEDKIERDLVRMRFLATCVVNSNPYLKKSIKPTELFTLPSEESDSPKVTMEQAQQIFDKWEKDSNGK